MSSFKYFKVTVSDTGVAHVETNRPKKHNSFNEETWTEYHAVFKHLANDTSAKVVILSGNGPNFCSGLDLSSVINILKGTKNGNLGPEFVHEFQRCINAPVEFDLPVISVSHGVSYGLALDIISATSIRLASVDTRFSIKEIDIGIMADIGSLQRLPLISGNVSKINEWALTGRDFSAIEAKEAGIVSDVLEDKDAALNKAREIAEVIASKYEPAIKGTKKHLDLMNVSGNQVKENLHTVGIDNTNLMNDPGYGQYFLKKFGKLAAKL